MIPVWFVLNLWLVVIASEIGVAWYNSRVSLRTEMPVSMLVFLAAFFTWLVFGAVLVSVHRFRRFSVREMFVAMTAAAVLIWLTIKCLT
jgi:hypothetical protein